MDAEFLTTWGTAIGIFLLTGALMQSLNATIGGQAGDRGLKGFYFVWKRFLLILLGGFLGSMAPLVGLSSPFGEGYGAGVLDGVLAAALAGQAYSLIIGSIRARVRHQLAKGARGEKPGG